MAECDETHMHLTSPVHTQTLPLELCGPPSAPELPSVPLRARYTRGLGKQPPQKGRPFRLVASKVRVLLSGPS